MNDSTIVHIQRCLSVLLLCLIHFMTGGCTDMNVIIYRYADGSGNTYIINKNTIEYVPVKPPFSSSGIYNGGEHIKKSITAGEYDSIAGLLNSALANTEVHIDNRPMGSGYIEIEKDKSITKVIIRPASEEQDAIEAMLKKIIG
jgi:hypothetical protein